MRIAEADRVKAHFDTLSSRYSRNFDGPRSGKRFEFVKRAELVAGLVSGRAGSLLDAACGTGEVTAAALTAGRFSRAELVDLSGAMLTRARHWLSQAGLSAEIAYHETDIFSFNPGQRVRFDVILCLGLIAHSGDLTRLLAHLRAMLAPDGLILLQTSLASHPNIRLTRALTARRFRHREGYDLSYFTLDDIDRSSREADLVLSTISRYRFGLPFGDRVWPYGNYLLERATQSFAAARGCEAICALTHSR